MLEAGSPSDTDEFESSVRAALTRALQELPDWMWEHEVTVHLPTVVADGPHQAAKLLFGKAEGVAIELGDEEFDQVEENRQAVVRHQLAELLHGELAAQVAAVANVRGVTSDELIDRLMSDATFDADVVRAPQMRTRNWYTGYVPVFAPTGLTVQFEPDPYLLHSLSSLRIPHSDYLDACARLIEANDYTFDVPGPFERSLMLAETRHESLAATYSELFESEVHRSAGSTIFSEVLGCGISTVSADDLVEAMSCWNRQVELYLHTACSRDTARNVGEVVARHRLDGNDLVVEVPEGYLSDSDAGRGRSSIDLSEPMEIALRKIRSRSGKAETVGREITLCDDVRGMYELHRLIESTDQRNLDQAPADLESGLDRMVQAVPRFMASTAAELLMSLDTDGQQNSLSSRAWGKLLQRDTMALTRDERDMGVLRVFDHALAGCHGRHIGEISWLIQKGADFNCRSRTGVTPLMVAAYLRDAAVLSVLVEAGADPTSQVREKFSGLLENAVSVVARPLVGARLIGSAEKCLNILLASKAQLPEGQIRPWAAMGLHADASVAALDFAVLLDHPGLVDSVLDQMSALPHSSDQQEIDRALYLSGRMLGVETGALLLAHGANPGGAVRGRDGKVGTVADAIVSERQDFSPDRYEQFMAMIRAANAKNIMLASARKPPPKSATAR